MKLPERYTDLPEVFIHPAAIVESDKIGPGTRVWAFAHVMPGAEIGAGCNLCDGAFLETGVVLGDRVTVKNNVLLWDRVQVGSGAFLGPNVVFTNDLRPRVSRKKGSAAFLPTAIEAHATLGANCTIVCGHRVGRYALVGAGAVVQRDVPDHALWLGNPGKQHGFVCACAEPIKRPDASGAKVKCEHCETELEATETGLRVLTLGAGFESIPSADQLGDHAEAAVASKVAS